MFRLILENFSPFFQFFICPVHDLSRNPKQWTAERRLGNTGVDILYRGADNSLARPGSKQARKYVRDARDFNNIERRAVIKFFFLQGKAPRTFTQF